MAKSKSREKAEYILWMMSQLQDVTDDQLVAAVKQRFPTFSLTAAEIPVLQLELQQIVLEGQNKQGGFSAEDLATIKRLAEKVGVDELIKAVRLLVG